MKTVARSFFVHMLLQNTVNLVFIKNINVVIWWKFKFGIIKSSSKVYVHFIFEVSESIRIRSVLIIIQFFPFTSNHSPMASSLFIKPLSILSPAGVVEQLINSQNLKHMYHTNNFYHFSARLCFYLWCEIMVEQLDGQKVDGCTKAQAAGQTNHFLEQF